MGLVLTLATTLRDVIHNWLVSACTTPWVVGLRGCDCGLALADEFGLCPGNVF